MILKYENNTIVGIFRDTEPAQGIKRSMKNAVECYWFVAKAH
jgi:hypothetical protein